MSSLDQALAAQAAVAQASSARVENRALGRIAVIVALICAFVTFVVLSDLTPLSPTHEVVVTLLAVDLLIVLLLSAIIGRELWLILQARRRGRAAARLHVRIIALFSLIAAAPAILVAVVASVTLDRGLDRLLSTRTLAMMENSMVMSDVYVADRAEAVRAQALAMALDLSVGRRLFDQDREQFRQRFTVVAANRGLAVAQIIGPDLAVIEKADSKVDLPVQLPSRETLASLQDDEPQVKLFPEGNYAAAISKLPNYENSYLFIAKVLDPRVTGRLSKLQDDFTEFVQLQDRRFGIQVAFALVYTVIALIATLSAVWIGLHFANYLVAPIRRLISAANLVSTGNLYVQLPIRRSEGDLAHLGETFNKMTQELRTQRDDLVRARDLIDSRRRFTEAVLAGASAGVIGVDAEGRVSILNRSAERLIGQAEATALGKPLAEVLPELADMLAAARTGSQRQGQVTISRNGKERNLSVRITSEQETAADHGYVITLDDITDLVSAQRTSAWADVARRIAHEIKNPLTPIQLSAERLRRKYGKIIVEDRDVFEQCTDTIVRQVDDIKRMVDEFSRFARTPKPVMTPDDVADAVRQTVFLMRVGHAEIDIQVEIATEPLTARFDRRLISQALTNIIKNATEGISAVPAAELGRGRIDVSAAREASDIVIDVIDNGIGLPKENRNRLLEPYVTTREKGTGLGLAIVGKILEEHGGGLELHDASERTPGARGAWVRLRFAAGEVTDSASPETPITKAASGH
ncbi:MAG: two-component system, NtrC family, nitrogen regulation sensor histidine kinase NtrY [Alphaproteobacteria bacterium]|jgi:two-component system nitrogen regulation sensor histidine kinase NtrY|nr:two-component system, NtrC family, nitrogen regulation sensor histidine kinase NtrY [Alphaproteobacteria bacterium]